MAKTIFHTTEQSNFILNMKPETLRKHCCNVMLLSVVLLLCSMLISALSQNSLQALSDTIETGGLRGILSLLVIATRSASSLFAIGGVLSMIYAFIALMKQQYVRSDLLPVILLGGMLLWGTVSLIFSYDTAMAFFGQDGRDEGLLAIIFYDCFFLLGMLLREHATIQRLYTGLLGLGMVECVWALLQSIPVKLVPSTYRTLFTVYVQNAYLPSGLSGSPILFAMLLTLLGALAIIGSLYAEKKKMRTFATVCAAVFLFFLLKTQCLIGALGACFLLVGAVITLCIKKGAVKASAKLAVYVAAVALSVLLASFAPSLNQITLNSTGEAVSDGYVLYDGGIIWENSYYQLSVSGPYFSSEADGVFEIDKLSSLYSYLWGKGLDAIAVDPLLGVGAENFMYTELECSMDFALNHNSADKPYNDYLYLAATRGIPSLLLYLGLLVLAVVRCIRNLRQSKSWLYAGLFLAILSFALISVIGISALSVAPIFWMLLGIACGQNESISQKPVAKKK